MILKKLLAIGVIALVGQSAFAERFVLNLGDAEFSGNSVIRLKQMLRDQHGIDARDYNLRGVMILSKTKFGRGTAALKVGDWVSYSQRVYGSPENFNRPNENTFVRTEFRNENRRHDGVWQILLEGNHKVRRIIVAIERDFGGGGGGGRTFTQVIDCSSWGRMTTQCAIGGGWPVGVRLLRQMSSTPCVEGRTFGLYQAGVWVSSGCRGTFEVHARR